MARLDPAGVAIAQGPPDLACDRAREEASAHPNAPVDFPAVDREAGFRERALPGEHVRVNGVDERPVEIKNESAHPWLGRA